MCIEECQWVDESLKRKIFDTHGPSWCALPVESTAPFCQGDNTCFSVWRMMPQIFTLWEDLPNFVRLIIICEKNCSILLGSYSSFFVAGSYAGIRHPVERNAHFCQAATYRFSLWILKP